MSIAICRVDKCSSSHDIAGIQIHDRRERQHSNSNPDIDFNRSKDNYSLCERSNGLSFNAAIDEIISAEYTSKRTIRKDAVRMVQVLFTSDSEFFSDKSASEQRAFFESCYKWAADKWGESHIISADVHMDEKTPHMHLNFVPLVKDVDKKTGKEITTLNVHKAVGSGSRALQKLQDEFYNAVGKPYGLERGSRADLDNGERPRKHQRTEQYKQTTQYHQATINALESHSQALQATIDNYNQIIQAEPQNAVCGVSVPSTVKLLIGKENRDKLLYSPTDIEKLQELAKTTAVIAADNQSQAATLSQREEQIERDRKSIIAKAKEKATEIIDAAKYDANESAEAANNYYFKQKKEADELLKQANARYKTVSEREQRVNQQARLTEQREAQLDEREQKIEQKVAALFELENRPDDYYQRIINEQQSQIDDYMSDILSLKAQLAQAKTDFSLQKELAEKKSAENDSLQQSMQQQNDQSQKRIDELSEQVRALEDDLVAKDRTISSLQAVADKNHNLYMAACDVGEYYDDNFVDKTIDRCAGDSISDIFRDRNRGYDR